MRNNEQGRSMIEMLGVLAIIGVLSVGGLAGYAKAMAKYRVNKTIDQVANVVANTRVLFGSQRTYKDLGATPNKTASDIIKNAKMLPDSLKGEPSSDANTADTYQNAYSGDFKIVYGNRFADGDMRAFVLAFTGIPEDACIDLATQDWNASAGSGLLAIGIEKAENPTSTANLENFQTQVKSGACEGTLTSTSISEETGEDVTEAVTGFAVYCAEKEQDPISLATATSACAGGSTRLTTIYFKFY